MIKWISVSNKINFVLNLECVRHIQCCMHADTVTRTLAHTFIESNESGKHSF